jgi:alpha-1,6-mannosyltransferase
MTAAAHERMRFYQLCALAVLLVALILTTPLALKACGDNGFMAVTVSAGLVVLVATYVAERGPAVRSLWFASCW